MSYLPSFDTTPAMVSLVAEITECTTLLEARKVDAALPWLRRANQIRTIHSSLQIEGNSLSLDEVTGIINGNRVVAPAQDIAEVKNAHQAYEALDSFDPLSKDDLLLAHRIMMEGLTSEVGRFRTVEVGVYAGFQLIHAGTHAEHIGEAMDELFTWLGRAGDHPLIKASFFHCAFECIHPFTDGNGRMGRLWHSLIMRKWRPVLSLSPVETMVNQHKSDYYQVLGFSDTRDATLFIEYMLEMTRDAIHETLEGSESDPPSTPQVPHKLDSLVENLLRVLGDDECSSNELMERLGLVDRKHFQDKYLRPAIKAGVIEPTIPDKPKSPYQKYRILSQKH